MDRPVWPAESAGGGGPIYFVCVKSGADWPGLLPMRAGLTRSGPVHLPTPSCGIRKKEKGKKKNKKEERERGPSKIAFSKPRVEVSKWEGKRNEKGRGMHKKMNSDYAISVGEETRIGLNWKRQKKIKKIIFFQPFI